MIDQFNCYLGTSPYELSLEDHPLATFDVLTVVASVGNFQLATAYFRVVINLGELSPRIEIVMDTRNWHCFCSNCRTSSVRR